MSEQTKTRFLDKPEDLEKLGLIKGVVQQREDGRVSPEGKPGSEVWYFDAVMDDGSKVTAGFRSKPIQNCESPVDDPVMVISITGPDGKVYADTQRYAPEEAEIALDRCYYKCGPHSVEGDLKKYHLVVKPIERDAANAAATDGMDCTSVKGVGVDLYMEALVEPFRHGAGRTIFNGDPQKYSSWFCIPKLTVTGTITLEGEEREVTGIGYHDHRCMMLDDMLAWHHWIWGRQHFDDYTVVIFDLVTAENYGYVRVPLFCVYDKDGRIIFDNDGDFTCEVPEEYWNEATQKHYPKCAKYHFKDQDKEIDYTLTWIDEMEARDMYTPFPEPIRAIYDAANQKPSYMRYFSNGDMTITENGKAVSVTGTMIYELAYCGKENSSVFPYPVKES